MLYSRNNKDISCIVAHASPNILYINMEALNRINSEYIDVFAGEAKPNQVSEDNQISGCEHPISTSFRPKPSATFSQNVAALLNTNPEPDAFYSELNSMQDLIEKHRRLINDVIEEHETIEAQEAYLTGLASRN